MAEYKILLYKKLKTVIMMKIVRMNGSDKYENQ